MSARVTILLVTAASATAVLALGGCGDDEEPTDTGSDISIGIPSATEPTDTSKGSAKQATVPTITEVPQPSEEEQQRINECVEQAKGDPNKIAACAESLSE